MADYVFNIAKGRVAEFGNRVKAGDPAAARLYIIPIATDVTQATAVDVDDFAAFVTAGGVERTGSTWARKTLAAADIAAVVPDDTNDRFPLTLATTTQTWTAVAAANNSVALLVCYASVASPTNAQLLPLTHHDFAVTTDGTDITATFTDLFRAS